MPKKVSIATLRKRLIGLINLYLQDLGFDKFQGTTAWRHLSTRIEIVNLDFVRPSDTKIIGCTSASFSLNGGICFKAVPLSCKIRVPFSEWLPPPYQMRKFHRRTIDQAELSRRDIWFIREDGSNLENCVADAIKVLREESEPWFLRFRDDRAVLQALLHEPDEADELGLLLSSNGTLGCPFRNNLIAYIALDAGELEVSRDAFEKLIEQNRKTPMHLSGNCESDYKTVLRLLEQQPQPLSRPDGTLL